MKIKIYSLHIVNNFLAMFVILSSFVIKISPIKVSTKNSKKEINGLDFIFNNLK